MKVGIIRGLGGNFFSVESALARCGAEVCYVTSKADMGPLSHLVLPGVGAFAPAIRRLETLGLVDAIKTHAEKGGSLLGICLGAQLLFDSGTEKGAAPGLGILKGGVQPLAEVVQGHRLPHTGWNWVTYEPAGLLESNDQPLDGYYYFNHEYYANPADETDVLAWTTYGCRIPVVFRRANVFGFQFHPEKSQELGLELLNVFLESSDWA